MIKKVALITGGCRGLGLACAERLLSDGFRTAVLDVSSRAVEDARKRLAETVSNTLVLKASVGIRSEVEDALNVVAAEWGRLDVLVNNAGISGAGNLMTQSEDDWDRVLDVNLKGVFICSRAAVPYLSQTEGAIINISSVAASGHQGPPAYVASKSGLIGLSRRIARELGGNGITVNVVAPGMIRTDWITRHIDEAAMDEWRRNTPLGRIGEPDDIAGAVSFLASKDARYITGQVLSVSGGYWMP